MFFRNLTLFQFPTGLAGVDRLDEHLDTRRLRSCGPMEEATRGFTSPFGRGHDVLSHASGAFSLVALGREERLLPGVVVSEALAEKIEAIRDKEARRVGAKERKRMREEIVDELLPRAFVRPARHLAYLDREQGWLVVDTASRSVAEDLAAELREALGSFPATPLAPAGSPRSVLTAWLQSGELPSGLELGDEVELRDPAEAGAVVRCRRQDLEGDEVREHLKSGKEVFQLGLVLDDRISFVLGEDLVIRKLRFLDAVLDELGDDTPESAAAELDATFTLMSLELRGLLGRLAEWFELAPAAEAAAA